MGENTFGPGKVAVILVVPMANEVASPLVAESGAVSMVATVLVSDVQVTDDVRSCFVPSVYVPVAINCFFVPRAIVGLAGVTSMDTSLAAVTVKCAVPEMTGSVRGTVAVIVMGPPAVTEVASPFLPSAALLMVATFVFEELQVTYDVRFCVGAFEYIPMAINCCFVPRAIVFSTGVTSMDSSVAAVTVSVV
jgi:hypothetical protein